MGVVCTITALFSYMYVHVKVKEQISVLWRVYTLHVRVPKDHPVPHS